MPTTVVPTLPPIPDCVYTLKAKDLESNKVHHFGGGVDAQVTPDGAVTLSFPEDRVLSGIEAQTTTGQFLTLLPVNEHGDIIDKPVVCVVYSDSILKVHRIIQSRQRKFNSLWCSRFY